MKTNRTLVHLLPMPFDNVHRLVAIHAHGPCMLPVLLLGKPIKSVYPVVNGPADMNIKILNTTFKLRGSRSRHDITIMWPGGNTIDSFWKPCHFVPLIPHTVECSTINIDDYEQVMSMALFKSKT